MRWEKGGENHFRAISSLSFLSAFSSPLDLNWSSSFIQLWQNAQTCKFFLFEKEYETHKRKRQKPRGIAKNVVQLKDIISSFHFQMTTNDSRSFVQEERSVVVCFHSVKLTLIWFMINILSFHVISIFFSWRSQKWFSQNFSNFHLLSLTYFLELKPSILVISYRSSSIFFQSYQRKTIPIRERTW